MEMNPKERVLSAHESWGTGTQIRCSTVSSYSSLSRSKGTKQETYLYEKTTTLSIPIPIPIPHSTIPKFCPSTSSDKGKTTPSKPLPAPALPPHPHSNPRHSPKPPTARLHKQSRTRPLLLSKPEFPTFPHTNIHTHVPRPVVPQSLHILLPSHRQYAHAYVAPRVIRSFIHPSTHSPSLPFPRNAEIAPIHWWGIPPRLNFPSPPPIPIPGHVFRDSLRSARLARVAACAGGPAFSFFRAPSSGPAREGGNCVSRRLLMPLCQCEPWTRASCSRGGSGPCRQGRLLGVWEGGTWEGRVRGWMFWNDERERKWGIVRRDRWMGCWSWWAWFFHRPWLICSTP
ncbi:hypothetical protein B0J11DRAFT_102399 [Dendryphion nanum]|uniref:Uncharacterized protein n=1 Tax=Dendryphion nanum TaxID=256645 RepID=A0A9P9DCX9_9PLEO|nr:hypothetical protein B0J11DRAFT_102399 [Dendryphion nanum]